MARAKALGLKLAWGRDGSGLFYQERKWRDDPGLAKMRTEGPILIFQISRSVGGILSTPFFSRGPPTPVHVASPSYGLKAVAAALGDQEPGRVILGCRGHPAYYLEDRASFFGLCAGDVRETRSDLGHPDQSFSCGADLSSGRLSECAYGSERPEDQLTSLARRCRRAPIPLVPNPQQYRGALCEVRKPGVIRDVWHCDVPSSLSRNDVALRLFACSRFLGCHQNHSELICATIAWAPRPAESATDQKEKTRSDALRELSKSRSTPFMVISARRAGILQTSTRPDGAGHRKISHGQDERLARRSRRDHHRDRH